jgi:hypothetical protein
MSQASMPIKQGAIVDDTPDDSPEWINRRATEQATRAAHARQVSGRRRFVDPTTCERQYSNAETEFMLAMNEYKRLSGRMFPTWSEVLEVLRGLGYEKVHHEGNGGDDCSQQTPLPVSRNATSYNAGR